MRDFKCYFFRLFQNGLEPNWNTACWALVRECPNQDIYICQFDDPLTRYYRRRLLWLINQITPCSLTNIHKAPPQRQWPDMFWASAEHYKELGVSFPKDLQYIKFHTFDNYDKSLVLLNFIRNLWHEPIPGYSLTFLKNLGKSRAHHKDPLARLTWANKDALMKLNHKNIYASPGHSNVHSHSSLKVKTMIEFKSWQPSGCVLAMNTRAFLTT